MYQYFDSIYPTKENSQKIMAHQKRLVSEINNKNDDYKFRSRLFALALVIILSFTIAQNTQASVSAAAFTLVTAIVSSSIDFGLDKAGKAWMPEHWSDFKKLVMTPLLKAYPDLVSNEQGNVTRKQAAREALLALENDKELKFAILTRLKNLEHGQEDLWEKVQILSLWIADHESRINRLELMLGITDSDNKLSSPPIIIDQSYAISVGSEGSAALVEYESVVRKIIQASRHGFRDIIKGEPYEINNYLKKMYEPTITLPGAEECRVGIATPESFSKSSFYSCTLMSSGTGFFILFRGIKHRENDTRKYPQAESWLQDAIKRLEPGQTYVSPPGMTVLTWEEALLTYLDTITRIRNAIPHYWEEQLPEYWESLREPRYWNGYKLRMRENHAYHYKRKNKRTPPANWDSYNVSSAYIAEASDGRYVRVSFQSLGPMEGQKMPRSFHISVNFGSSD